MDPLDLVASTADAMFAIDRTGRIVAWNPASERLLGHTAANVIGRPCSEVLCGIDTFGNPYCSEHCMLLASALRNIPLRRCELSFKTQCGKYVPVTISTLRVPNSDPEGIHILHLMHQIDRAAEGATHTGRAGSEVSGDLPALTARETHVLRLVAEGHAVEEIADQLSLGETTIRTHLRNIRGKLQVHSTLDAACLALRNGLI